MAANTLAQARSLAAEGFVRWICEFDLTHGPRPYQAYVNDEDFVPAEPAWLREKVSSRLPNRLKQLWNQEETA